MKKIIFTSLLALKVLADDVDDPLLLQYQQLEATDCYCNHGAEESSLINGHFFIPSEEKLNEETSQMILDAHNQQYLINEFLIKGLAGEANEFTPHEEFFPNFIYAEKELNFEFEKKNRIKCVALDVEINAVNNQIALAEIKLSEILKNKK